MSEGNIKFYCQLCRQYLEAPTEMAGEEIECPSCNQKTIIPSADSAKSSKVKKLVVLKQRRLGIILAIVSIIIVMAGFVGWFIFKGKSLKGEGARLAESSPSISAQPLSAVSSDMKLSKKIQATIKGGAWLTKQSGNSDVIRGLTITLYKAKITNKVFLDLQKVTLAGLEESGKIAKSKIIKWKQIASKHPNNKFIQEDYKLWELLSIKQHDNAEKIRNGIDQSSNLDQNAEASVDFAAVLEPLAKMSALDGISIDAMRDSYARKTREAREAAKEQIDEFLAEMRKVNELSVELMYSDDMYAAIDNSGAKELLKQLLEQQYVATTKTGIDGTYEMKASEGSFYLLAEYDSSFNKVEWCVPVKVSEPGDLKVNLDNENASVIKKKEK